MSYITRNLLESITAYTPGTPDGYGGLSFSKITVKARWEEKREMFRDSNGNETVSVAIVYVDTDVPVGGYLYHGLSTASSPTGLTEAREVRGFSKIPNLRQTEYERKCFL